MRLARLNNDQLKYVKTIKKPQRFLIFSSDTTDKYLKLGIMKSKNWSKILLLVWGTGLTLLFASVMSFHYVAYKTPILKGLNQSQGFVAHHFISQYCNCSKGILKHLTERKILSGVTEIVHLIGDDNELIKRLKTAGFEVEKMAEEEAVTKYNIEALPLIVVVQNGHEIYQVC
jgi:hypothetical protein